ncbi:hypothetical protein DFH28DRAFT_339180 [Melampsora americana]|nr:hypothetical protein DFH28DRAFT_339180 [Melampsora americana]
MPFLPSAYQVAHPLNPIYRMASSVARKNKGKGESDERSSQRHQGPFMTAGLPWKPTQASNSPHSVDWSMDGSGPTGFTPHFESSPRHRRQRSDLGSQRHRQRRPDVDSQHHSPNRGQFQRRKALTEEEEQARESTRLKVQQKVERRMRALQTKKDRAERRQARKGQKVKDHLDELERRRQIRIKGENHETNCALIYFPTSIEANSKKMKKLKKIQQKLISKKSTSTEPIENENDHVNPMFRESPNHPLASPKFHHPMNDSQPLAGPSQEADKCRKSRLDLTDRPLNATAHQVPPSHEPHPVNSPQNTRLVVTPESRTPSEKEAHSPEPTPVRSQSIRHPSSTPQPLSAGYLSAQGPLSSPQPVANHDEMQHPSAISHQITSTTKHPSSGLDVSRITSPHQTPLSRQSSYTTTQSDDTHISSITHTLNQDSPPHRIYSHPPFSTPASLDTGDFALKNQLAKMYMTEEGTTNPTPEQNQRSEVEFGWLKSAAQREIQKTRIGTFSPTSLSDHLKVQEQTNLMVQELMKEWIGEYTVNKKPIAYIIGDVPFGNVQIAVQPPILIPRPETEQWTCKLSDMIKSWSDSEDPNRSRSQKSDTSDNLRKIDLKILDIGTGSGCIATYLAYNHPNVFVMGIDVDNNAIELAKRNAFTHGLTYFQRQALQNTRSKVIHHRGQASFMNLNLFSSTFVEDVLNGLRKKSEIRNEPLKIDEEDEEEDERFDMIISNPPYITKNEYKGLPSSVKNWESEISLIGDKTLSLKYSHQISNSQTLSPPHQFRTSQSFNQPIPIHSNSLLPKTVSMMQELGLKLPKKIRESFKDEELDERLKREDGLDFYKEILNQISSGQLLKPRLNRLEDEERKVKENLPKIIFEVGKDQAEEVKGLMINKLKDSKMISKVVIWNDFFGISRVVVGF